MQPGNLLLSLLSFLLIHHAVSYSFYGDSRTYMNPFFSGFGSFGYGQSLPWYGMGSTTGNHFPGWGYGNTFGYSALGFGLPWMAFMVPHNYMNSLYGMVPWYGYHGYPGHYGVYQMYGYGNNYNNNGYYSSGYGQYNSGNTQRYYNSYGNSYNKGYGNGPVYVPVPHPVPVPIPHRRPNFLDQLGLGGGSGLSSLLVPALLVAAVVKG